MKRNAALRGLVVILLVGLGLRLVHLGWRTLWYDEAFAVLFARTGLDRMLYGTLTPVAGGAADIHPLLYYTTLNGWMRVFGESPVMVRLYSVLIGVLTIAVVYRLAADLFRMRKIGVAAALITALAPFHIQYSQETRMYALLTLFLLLATWCYLRGWRGRGASWWAVFGVLAALAMYTQQLAAFYLAALGLTPLLARRRDRLWRTAVAAALAFALYLPWFVNLPGQLSKLQSYYWVERPSLARPLLTLRSFLVVALDLPETWTLPTFFVAVVLAVFLLLQVGLRWRRLRGAERRALGWTLWLSFGSLALMWIASQVFTPVYLDRALLAQGVMLYAALGWFVLRGGLPKPILAVLVGAWVFVMVLGYATHVNWQAFPNPPFDRAADQIALQFEPGDVILHSNKLTALPVVYYRPDLPQTYMADRPGAAEDTLALPTQEVLGLPAAPCMAAAANGAERVWFVIFRQEEAQYLAMPGVDEHPHLGWLRDHYAMEGEPLVFGDLLVLPFSGPDGYAPQCDAEDAS